MGRVRVENLHLGACLPRRSRKVRVALNTHLPIPDQALTVAISLYAQSEDHLADQFVAEFWRQEPTTQAAFEQLVARYVMATWTDGDGTE